MTSFKDALKLLMKRPIIAACALLYSAFGAYADPVTEFLDGVFTQPHAFIGKTHEARLHPSKIGYRSTHDTIHWSDTYAAPAGARTWRASFYGGGPKRFEPNTHTASGELFNQWALTAAHRTLPIGTRLQVCYRGCAVVRVNDRGPAAWTGRNLDLSRGAASQIGMIKAGTANVAVSVLN